MSPREEIGLRELVEAIDDAGDDRKIEERVPRIKMGSSNHVEMVHSLYREKIFQIFHVEHVGILFFVESGEVELGRM